MTREKFKFWLDLNKDDELLIAETIDELKRQRSFVSTIRDGIRLICDLRQGKLNVLFELFPWVKAALQTPMGQEGDDLKRKIDLLEQLILVQYSDSRVEMIADGLSTPTNRPSVPKLPSVQPSLNVELDTSEAFLNAF